MGGPDFGRATLTDCDREAIHMPGSIQPHGCLVVVRPDDGEIIQAAGDFTLVFGAGCTEPLGRPLADLVGTDAAAELLASPKRKLPDGPMDGNDVVLETPHSLIDARPHASEGLIVIEFELPEPDGRGIRDAILTLQNMVAALEAAPTIEAYYKACTEQVRAATGFDRVMVYRFLKDGSGVVVAETKDDGLESYLGLHYPESDIPKQARELYRKTSIRSIPDVNYTPAPLRPPFNPVTNAPLDLSYSQLRSVSPIHVQYLKNMGVSASMSISILCRGALWGLIACHHRKPHRLPYHLRAVCSIFGRVFSLQLEARENTADLRYRLQQRAVIQQIVSQLSQANTLSEGLIAHYPNLLDFISADGVAVWVEGAYAAIGRVPERSHIEQLIDLLNARDDDGLFAFDCIAEVFPPAHAMTPAAAGVLALSVSRTPRDYILWFRREIIETVTWAGNLQKAVMHGEGESLSPRRSFAAWTETVRGRSHPWKQTEVEAAKELRVAILEDVLRRIDQIARERAEAAASQALLVAELNHRVKNTLSIIQAIINHTKGSADSVESYIANLEQRIQAMGHAQSLLSESRWRGASLRRLMEEERAQFGTHPERVFIEGSDIDLKPKAALSIAMVVHELFTNAAKYGALSTDTGRLDICWHCDLSTLHITWRETGGPPVVLPKRQGFGRMLIETSLSYDLDGVVDLRFAPAGVECDIAISLQHVLAP